MLGVADWILHGIHILIIALNLFGWMWPRTRRLGLISLVLTAACWFGLGFFYGFGYCPLTDLQWEIKGALGQKELPGSYVSYLITHLTAWRPKSDFVDGMVAGSFFMAVIATLWTRFRKA